MHNNISFIYDDDLGLVSPLLPSLYLVFVKNQRVSANVETGPWSNRLLFTGTFDQYKMLQFDIFSFTFHLSSELDLHFLLVT